MVVYTWWGWHIYKGDEVGVDVDQLGEKMEVTGSDRTLVSVGPVRPVSGGRQRAASVNRPDAGCERPVRADVW